MDLFPTAAASPTRAREIAEDLSHCTLSGRLDPDVPVPGPTPAGLTGSFLLGTCAEQLARAGPLPTIVLVGTFGSPVES